MTYYFSLSGPEPLRPIPEGSLGRVIMDSLVNSPKQRPALVDGISGYPISFDAVLFKTVRLAEALKRRGFKPGSIIAMCSENILDYFCPIIAAFYIGAIAVPINPNYNTYQMKHILNLCQPDILFCSKAVIMNFAEEENTRMLVCINCVDTTQIHMIDGAMTIDTFLLRVLEYEVFDLLNYQTFDDCNPAEYVAAILCTSGTTGVPKAVMLTHRNIIARLVQSRERRKPYLRSDRSVLGLMPFYHGYGFHLALESIYNHDQLVVLKKFEPDIFLKAIQDYKISCLDVNPPEIEFMATTAKLADYDLSCVKEIFCGNARIVTRFEDMLKERLTTLKYPMIRKVFGMTESCFATTISIPKYAHKSGPWGRVASSMQLRVVSFGSEKPVGFEEHGEIWIKGPLVMRGYYKDGKANNEVFTSDGWLKTGDIGYYDLDKHVFIVDRLKELIKNENYLVFPTKLESIICNHPSISDAGVVGVPDRFAGQLPMALVVKREGFQLSEKELNHYMSITVPSQSQLRGGIVFVSTIPRNELGKIIRKDLKEMVDREKKARSYQAGTSHV